MNFEIHQKVLALPLSTTENSVLVVLSNYAPRDGNSCFPSYDTIRLESGAANKTISKAIRTLRYAGIINFRHRAKVGTGHGDGGKEPNEYKFTFEDIKFYKSKGKWKLSKHNHKTLKAKIREYRTIVKAEMEQESRIRKEKKERKAIQSHSNAHESVIKPRIHKSQSVKIVGRNTQGLDGVSIPSHFNAIPSQKLRRKNIASDKLTENFTKGDSSIRPCNKKNQKTVLQDKVNYSVSDSVDNSKNSTLIETGELQFKDKSETLDLQDLTNLSETDSNGWIEICEI